jgi:hypothetical protein
MKVIDALTGEVSIGGCFSEDKGALQNGLGVASKAFGGPTGIYAVIQPRRFNVRLQCGGVTENACSAGVPDSGIRIVGFLCHRSDQTGEFGWIAIDDFLSKIDIGQYPLERIVE